MKNTNSHDGSSSFNLMAGLFRLACSNGMVVADSTFGSHKIRHMGYADYLVKDAIEDMMESIPRIESRVKEFQEIELTKDEAGVYVQSALIAKYGEEAVNDREFRKDMILAPKRREDTGDSLWKIYNRVQEKLINGGRFEVKQDRERAYRKYVGKAKAVNSINENIRINQALWTLTEEMAKIKTA